jgi:hypothetical protein
VQIPLQRFEQVVQDGELSPGSGLRYNKNDEDGGCTYIELDVDDHPTTYHMVVIYQYKKTQPKKPMIIMDQDKCIFKQYTLATKS